MRPAAKVAFTTAAVAAAAFLLIAPATAPAASTVSLVQGPKYQYFTVFGDEGPNTIAISFVSEKLAVTEPGISTSVPTCTDSGDTITCSASAVRFELGGGDDTLTADGTIPVLFNAGVYGGPGADRIAMGAGFDDIDGGPGADAMSGGPGFDQVRYDDRATPVTATIGGGLSGNELDGMPTTGDTIAADFEILAGGTAGDTLTGGDGNDILYGELNLVGGPDLLVGLAGNDRLFGGPGPDRLLGGPGRDGLTGEGGRDRLLGQTGIDRLFAENDDRDRIINCGPGKNRLERAARDGIDPRPRSC